MLSWCYKIISRLLWTDVKEEKKDKEDKVEKAEESKVVYVTMLDTVCAELEIGKSVIVTAPYQGLGIWHAYGVKCHITFKISRISLELCQLEYRSPMGYGQAEYDLISTSITGTEPSLVKYFRTDR